MNVLYSIPPPHAVTTSPHGLLASPDLWVWAFYAIVGLAALCLMPTGLWESAKALYAPVGRFLAGLHVTCLWDGLFVWAKLSGAFLRPLKTFWDDRPEDQDEMDAKWPTVSADNGFRMPVLT